MLVYLFCNADRNEFVGIQLLFIGLSVVLGVAAAYLVI
ncbi:hypothetical protein JOD25_003404 [Kurthia huakuii]|nr:hypothetical protein [Kurthia huakuii]